MRPDFPGFFRVVIPLSLILLLTLTSCSRLGYIVEQGLGQLRIQNRARENKDVLQDPTIPKEYKGKILLIQEYKEYFYRYFGQKISPHYEKTMILGTPAPTYLVVASPYDTIKPHWECFPLVGCFPYLGFFREESLEKYARKLEEKGLVTWKRPVYAYSSLGHFPDPILSSFFYFDPLDLAELVFHELFHTVFFVKDEVELNENLANYVGKELGIIFFHYDEKKRKELEEKDQKNRAITRILVEQVKKLQEEYDRARPLDQIQASALLQEFLKGTFYPRMEKACRDLAVEAADCFPLDKERTWNNASFAAYLTYEEKQDEIGKLREFLKLDLKEFLRYLREKYEEYRDQGDDVQEGGSFGRYLFAPLKEGNLH